MTSLIGSSAMAVEAVLEMAVRLNQESRSSGKFVVMRQVRGQARRSICRSGSGSGPVIITWVRHSLVINRQVHSDEAGPRSSQEVSLQIRVQINTVYVQAQT